MALDGRWNIDRLKSQVTGTIDSPTRDQCIQWCQNIGLLPHRKHCYKCGKIMIIVNTSPESSGAKQQKTEPTIIKFHKLRKFIRRTSPLN
jgi:hypothetical protein